MIVFDVATAKGFRVEVAADETSWLIGARFPNCHYREWDNEVCGNYSSCRPSEGYPFYLTLHILTQLKFALKLQLCSVRGLLISHQCHSIESFPCTSQPGSSFSH